MAPFSGGIQLAGSVLVAPHRLAVSSVAFSWDLAIPKATVVFPSRCRPRASMRSQVVCAWSSLSQTVITVYQLAHAEGETSTADAARVAVPQVLQASYRLTIGSRTGTSSNRRSPSVIPLTFLYPPTTRPLHDWCMLSRTPSAAWN